MRLNSNGELETLTTEDWLALRDRLRAAPATDTPYIHILRQYVHE